LTINLHDVTLVAVATTKIDQTIAALNYSSQQINFAEVCLLTHSELKVNSKIKVLKIKKFESSAEWGEFIIFELKNFIKTKFILLIHWDGFVVNPKSWNSDFLNYDYIGSPWPSWEKVFPDNVNKYPDKNFRVGNSVSLRSKRFLEIPSKINLKWKTAEISNYHEDGFLCVQSRHLLENNGIKFAPFELALKFGREYSFKENLNIDPFVFHKWYAKNKYYPVLLHRFGIKEKIKRFVNFGYF
jgi:hypothetical protein